MSVTDSDLKALEKFIVGNADLERLEAMLGSFNIFEAVGMNKQEIWHSRFLAFFLDPSESHGLGDVFLKRFLQSAAGDSSSVTPLEISLLDFSGVSVRREWNYMDIFAFDETNKLCVIVENKILSYEHSDQLARYFALVREAYPGYRTIAIYLTPAGSEPSHPEYLSLSYGAVCEAMDGVRRRNAGTVESDVTMAMEHYTDMLRRRVVSDSEVARLAERIYERHGRAIDLIVEHKAKSRDGTTALLLELIDRTPGLELDREAGEKTRFAVTGWDTEANLSGTTSWSSANRVLLFEVLIKPPVVRLSLFVGPGDSSVREALFDFARRAGGPFAVRQKLAKDFNRIYSRYLASDDTSPTEVEAEVCRNWEVFVDEDLPRMDAALKEEGWHQETYNGGIPE